MARIAGSLWSVPRDEAGARLREVVAAGLDRVHWDVTDGVFARDGGFTPEQAEECLAGVAVANEAHLMVGDPLPHIDRWSELCTVIAVHAEIPDLHEALRRIEQRGCRPALVASPTTPLAGLPVAGLDLLLMSVTPGHAGSAFLPGTLDRIRQATGLRGVASVGVDGGVTAALWPALAAAGTDWIVTGSALFSDPDPGRWLERCRRSFD